MLRTFRCPAMLLDTPPLLHPPQAPSSAPARGLFLQLGPAWGPGLGRLFPPGHCCKHQGPWHTCFHLGTSNPRMLFSRPLRARGSSTKSRCSYLLHTSLNKAHVSPVGAPPPTQGRPRLPLPLIFPLPIWCQHSCHHLKRSCMKQVLTERQSQQRRPHREQR